MSEQLGPIGRALSRVWGRRDLSVVITIDVEPDPQSFDPRDDPPWLGFERLVESLPALRDRLSTATGSPATFNWFIRMDPQVEETWGSAGWPAERYVDEFADLAEAGDEIGLHTHIWRWDERAREWICDFEDSDWGQHCVEVGLDAFEESFGRSCTAHRGGTHFLSGAMFETLEKRGVPLDFSVEPGLAPLGPEDFTFIPNLTIRGQTPDYRQAATRPYRSTRSAFPAPDPDASTGPLLVPAMSAPRRRPPFRRMPLLLWDDQGFATRFAIELLRRPPVINFAMRTDAVIGPWSDTIQQNLDTVAAHPGVTFRTVSDALHGEDRAPVRA